MLPSQELDMLQRLYERQTQNNALNIEMRTALRQHASAKGLKFEQDRVGNVYLGRPEKDPTLASLAIAFPIDALESPRSFTDTFLAFEQLIRQDLLCGVTLMGFTSLDGKDVGLELWEKAVTMPEGPTVLPKIPLLDEFSGFPSPSAFAFSAIFQISELTDTPLSVSGSSILIMKAKKVIQGKEITRITTQEFRRAPRLKLQGSGSVEVTRRVICAYSEYVVALFENFD